ncbi:hypothetical protein [Streptomyces aureocirculatus]|uniref:hypothetical protein n=1 Tax=Streptomyces aureocirculatus TaxID=67275 RepID=UPI0004CA6FED|nr:hypothetical protein [Streptomyces aureocirculatus]
MSNTVNCDAFRHDRTWVVRAAEHGVYGHGRTLKRAGEDVEQGLALIGVTAPITITVRMPELEKLRAAEAAYDAALREAVQELTLRQTTVRDTVLATGASTAQVKSLRAVNAKDGGPARHSKRDLMVGGRTCVIHCAEDPETASSLSGQRHVHPEM